MNLGHGIRLTQRKSGLTQRVLATRLGVSSQYVSLIEANLRVSNWETICRLASGMEVTVTQLVGEAEALSSTARRGRV